MEIPDEPRVSPETEDPFELEVRGVFQETLGLIHIALVTHYDLEELEAIELEKDLYVWFVRFCMRPGNFSPRQSRPFLVVACCQFAREYQKYLIGTGVREPNETLRKLLDREPSDVARDFNRKLEFLNLRHSDA
jgi:hypothetical protein